jgi:hypothetical protein
MMVPDVSEKHRAFFSVKQCRKRLHCLTLNMKAMSIN